MLKLSQVGFRKYQGCDLTKVWVSLWSRGQSPPEPPGCLILEDLQPLHILTNKKLEVWTQYRLLLFQKYFEAQGDLKKNPAKSQA